MKKKWLIVLIIVVLLIIGLRIRRIYEKKECENEYESCMKEREAGMKVICFPCNQRILFL